MADVTLPLNYNREGVPVGVLSRLEQAARRAGLDLESLELLGQDTNAAVGFISAEQQGVTQGYLSTVDFETLRLTRVTRERYGDRIYVAGAPPATA